MTSQTFRVKNDTGNNHVLYMFTNFILFFYAKLKRLQMTLWLQHSMSKQPRKESRWEGAGRLEMGAVMQLLRIGNITLLVFLSSSLFSRRREIASGPKLKMVCCRLSAHNAS